jgi:hypothetical protein
MGFVLFARGCQAIGTHQRVLLESSPKGPRVFHGNHN